MKKRVVAVSATLLLLMSGCAANPAADGTSSPSAESGGISERGNEIKKVGDVVDIEDDNEENPTLSFSVTSIDVDAPCKAPDAVAPQHGHFVTLKVDGQTSPELKNQFFIVGNSWRVVADDGVTFELKPFTEAASKCISADDRLPTTVGANESFSGTLVLDVPTETGTLVLKDWEWAYPQ